MQQSWPAVLTRPDEYLAALRSTSEAFGMVRNPLPTSLLEREPVHVVSQRLGHATPMVTLTIYAHVMPGNQRETARTFARLVRQARGA